ncbi:MAG: hypothetical protein ACI8ZB_005564 [Desulforhopalus sp.]|jgi:hypothetical protein
MRRLSVIIDGVVKSPIYVVVGLDRTLNIPHVENTIQTPRLARISHELSDK